SAVSRPSMPGMLTSSRITAHSLSSSQRSASSPEEAVTMFWSSSSRIVRKTTRLSRRSSTIRMLERSSGAPASASLSTAGMTCDSSIVISFLQPGLEDRDQLVAVHGLRQVVPRARLDAALAVALHGFRGHGHDRQVLAMRDLADLLHRLQA